MTYAISIFHNCAGACSRAGCTENLPCRAGVVGLAVAEAIRPRLGAGKILHLSSLAVACGFATCIPWGGSLNEWQYGFGCFVCAFAAAPMTSFSERLFTAGVVKMHGEDAECGWLVTLWRMTGTPARIVAPIAFGYGMELDQVTAQDQLGPHASIRSCRSCDPERTGMCRETFQVFLYEKEDLHVSTEFESFTLVYGHVSFVL